MGEYCSDIWQVSTGNTYPSMPSAALRIIAVIEAVSSWVLQHVGNGDGLVRAKASNLMLQYELKACHCRVFARILLKARYAVRARYGANQGHR
jgi:hypothetical protein